MNADENDKPKRARRVEPSDELWDAALVAYLPTQGTKARESAQKWAESATALLAIIGITTIFKGRETLEAVAPDRQLPILTSVTLALAAAFATLFLASWATRGELQTGWATPGNLKAAQVSAVEHANRWTKWSQVAVVVAFGAALAAVLLIWTAPKPDTEPTNVLVINGAGQRACGELKATDGKLTAGGQPVPPHAVTFLVVKECP